MVAKSSDKTRKVEPGISKLVDGRYQVEFRPAGGRSGRKVRGTFELLEAARKFKADETAKAKGGVSPIFSDNDDRRLSNLIEEWYSLHGYSLKDGAKRKGKLLYDCALMNDPVAKDFTAEKFILFRKSKLTTLRSPSSGKMISANSVNHSQAYVSAVFNTLKKLGKWSFANPLSGLPLLKIDEPELCYLEKDQIRALLHELQLSSTPDLYIISKICLSTGARWGEASTLKATQVKGGKVHYSKTKSGKARSIPIATALEEEILNARPKHGLLFNQKNHRRGFLDALVKAKIELPDGQLTHVLRHTFASHFMINDGNILKLKDILGHSSLDMTLRYAKLAPSHLSQALTHNPLATLITEIKPT